MPVQPEFANNTTLQVIALSAFKDNYIWLLLHPGSRMAWVVDPGDAEPVLAYLRDHHLQLEGVLLTHHHSDHDGGIPTLLKHFPTLRVISGLNSQSPYTTERLADGAALQVLNNDFIVMDVPGHTLDHVAFYCSRAKLLFSGDTLFAGGCGRLFEGNAKQLFESLGRIAALPATTRNYCAHEYTLNNLRFALAVEPDNLALQQRVTETKKMREQHEPTVPSFLSLELATNPFLRCHEPSIMTTAQRQTGGPLSTALDVFAVIRSWKDHF